MYWPTRNDTKCKFNDITHLFVVLSTNCTPDDITTSKPPKTQPVSNTSPGGQVVTSFVRLSEKQNQTNNAELIQKSSNSYSKISFELFSTKCFEMSSEIVQYLKMIGELVIHPV